MVTIDATTVKNKFGETIDIARSEPVTVTKSGRSAVVILSIDEYEHLRRMEDAYWVQRAKEAEAGGFIGADASDALVKDLLSAAKES